MSDPIGAMVANIKRILSKNGFPQNSVSLPLEKLYETAHRDGINFNKVLEQLEREGMSHTKTTEKIIFSLSQDSEQMMAKAREMMKGMSPEQIAEIKKMYDNMTPEERNRIMDMAKSFKSS